MKTSLVQFVLISSALLLAYSQGHTIRKRIVNGNEVKLGEMPYIVSLQLSGSEHFCGGSIVSEYYVVTAAHCIQNMEDPSVVIIVAGTVNYKEPGKTYEVEKLIQHEKFSYTGSSEYDIALIKTKTRIEFNDRVKPVKLPKSNEVFEIDSVAVVAGWGQTGFGRTETSLKLLKAEILVADQKYCTKVMEEANYVGKKVLPSNICAYEPNIRKGHCSFDSGGPLIIDNMLAGIVSWSVKDPYCASTKYPGIYTRVSDYVDWIATTTK